MPHQYAKVDLSISTSAELELGGVPEICEEEEANCLVSATGQIVMGEMAHVPMIDLDFEARLVPSSTPGHFHLILDGCPMPEKQYERLLTALVHAGVLQQGNLNRFERDRMSVLRKPGVKKQPSEQDA